MGIESSPILELVDLSQLTAIARQSVQRESLQIQDWNVRQLGGGAGNPVSVGLYRFEGIGQDRDEQFQWSAILKILQSPANSGWVDMGEGEDQNHWNYWKRELLIYQSDLLKTLPQGLAAPRCYDAVELPGNIAMLWLEDIHDSYAGTWSLDRYALTARHLGRLNGMYLSSYSRLTYPWFSMHRNRQWIATMPHWQTFAWEHSRVLDRYPRPEVNSFRRMLLQNELFLAKLDLLPKTVCHGDTYPTNFMSRRLADGQELTIALDWALLGIQAIGDDLGQLVFGAQINLGEDKREIVTQALFESYIEGLRDSGCHIDPRTVRFGFVASAALRVGLFQVYLLGEEIKQSKNVGQVGVEHAAIPDCFEVTMANEAYELLEII